MVDHALLANPFPFFRLEARSVSTLGRTVNEARRTLPTPREEM
jgi:hypothetical protein